VTRQTLHGIIERIREEAGCTNQEIRLRRRGGKLTWALLSLSLLAPGAQAEPELVGTLVDISEQKDTEARLRAELFETRTLLKEIHHRVKNNFQITASLLNLEAATLGTEARTQLGDDSPLLHHITDTFRGCRERINAIALVHETLYLSRDLASVDLQRYISTLANNLFVSHGSRARGVKLKIDVAVAPLGIKYAVPCGLIINELVANSLKHAFPEGNPGEIIVRVSEDEAGRIRLVVEDTGRGLPRDFSIERCESLGMRLVKGLTKQLGGMLEITSEGGTKFLITFPVARDDRRSSDESASLTHS